MVADEVLCARAGCGHGYTLHHPTHGPCQETVRLVMLGGPHHGAGMDAGCDCRGFLWVDPEPAPPAPLRAPAAS